MRGFFSKLKLAPIALLAILSLGACSPYDGTKIQPAEEISEVDDGLTDLIVVLDFTSAPETQSMSVQAITIRVTGGGPATIITWRPSSAGEAPPPAIQMTVLPSEGKVVRAEAQFYDPASGLGRRAVGTITKDIGKGLQHAVLEMHLEP